VDFYSLDIIWKSEFNGVLSRICFPICCQKYMRESDLL